jgi:hypothetical protein
MACRPARSPRARQAPDASPLSVSARLAQRAPMRQARGSPSGSRRHSGGCAAHAHAAPAAASPSRSSGAGSSASAAASSRVAPRPPGFPARARPGRCQRRASSTRGSQCERRSSMSASSCSSRRQLLSSRSNSSCAAAALAGSCSGISASAAARGAPIQRCGGRRDLQIRTAARRDRQLRGQPVIEGVDGLDAQARRVAQQLPTAGDRARAPPAAAPHRCRESRLPALGRLQRRQNAVAHLGRGLAREGDGQDLLRAHRPPPAAPGSAPSAPWSCPSRPAPAAASSAAQVERLAARALIHLQAASLTGFAHGCAA